MKARWIGKFEIQHNLYDDFMEEYCTGFMDEETLYRMDNFVKPDSVWGSHVYPYTIFHATKVISWGHGLGIKLSKCGEFVKLWEIE